MMACDVSPVAMFLLVGADVIIVMLAAHVKTIWPSILSWFQKNLCVL